MKPGVASTGDIILITADDPDETVKIILDNVHISSNAFYQYETSLGHYGAPAIWIETNSQSNVEIIYKGDCYLRGTNQFSAIMKYNNGSGGKLTVKPYGTEKDTLTLAAQAAFGIGSHSDAESYSDNVHIEGGRIIGSVGAKGVTNYTIEGGCHSLWHEVSGRHNRGVGSVTINGGTIVTPGAFDGVVVTYNGGNFYSVNETKVKNGAGAEARLVVFPASAGLTGVEIDGKSYECTANEDTNDQLYTYLSKENHNVTLIYGSTREEHQVSFIGNIPRVTGAGNAVYPKWALVDIKNADITGIEKRVPYTGKEVTFTDLKVVIDGYELAEGQDYEVEYENNINNGFASYYIKGINTFSGVRSGSFYITSQGATPNPEPTDTPKEPRTPKPGETPTDAPSEPSGTTSPATPTATPPATQAVTPTVKEKAKTIPTSKPKSSAKLKTIPVVSVDGLWKNSKKIKGYCGVKGVTVKIKIGKKAYKKAKVKGKHYTLKTSKLKKKTKIIIKFIKKGYKTRKLTRRVS